MTSTPTTTAPEPNDSLPPTQALLVNVARAAEILCLSRPSIYQLIWSDQLVPIRIGRSVRFSFGQLEQVVAERTLDRPE